jgi:MFS family permease
MLWNKEQYSILAMVAITSFMGTFLISSVNIALPAIGEEFGLGAVSLSWMITAFLLASAMFLLPAGRLGDARGIRRLFKTGVTIFTITSLLCAMAPGGHLLIFFRFLQGTGAALTSTTGPAILVSAFPHNQRGRVLGITIAAVYLGLATGPLLGGFLTQMAGWRYIFIISGFTGILLIIGSMLVLPKDIELPARPRVNLRGLWFYMPGLVLLVSATAMIPGWSGWMVLITGLLLLMAFWLHERKTDAPVFDTRLFSQNRLFAFSNLAALINYSAGWRRPTLPRFTAVPSARPGLTSLFGMGRGGTPAP